MKDEQNMKAFIEMFDCIQYSIPGTCPSVCEVLRHTHTHRDTQPSPTALNTPSVHTPALPTPEY